MINVEMSLWLDAGSKLAMDCGWCDRVLFYEFFNPDTGRGHGARCVHWCL